jgi:hypothetical protein
MDDLSQFPEIPKNLSPPWLAVVLGVVAFAWALRHALPHIMEAIVKDRENRRNHDRQMKELEARLVERRARLDKPDPRPGQGSRRRGRNR